MHVLCDCRLPSFNAEFTASTPLTRIRDIAHRNDIPHDLKQEIKHTIQVGLSPALFAVIFLGIVRFNRTQYLKDLPCFLSV